MRLGAACGGTARGAAAATKISLAAATPRHFRTMPRSLIRKIICSLFEPSLILYPIAFVGKFPMQNILF